MIRIISTRRTLAVVLAWLTLLGSGAVRPAAQAAPATPGLPVPPSNAVDYFRSLLAMAPEQRMEALAEKSEQQRAVLEMKIREYATMPDKERELRLRLLEIRFHVLPLMRIKPEERGPMLEQIPASRRWFVEYRLQDWDRLDPQQQSRLLASMTSLHFFLYRGYARTTTTPPSPPNQDAYREAMIAKWRGLSEEQRQEIVDRFDLFVAMEQRKKEAVLLKLPMPDQKHAERTLRRVEALSPEQRTQFLSGLRKFADLDGLDRTRFLLRTERWSNMSLEERSLWRSIIVKAQPPPPAPGDILTP